MCKVSIFTMINDYNSLINTQKNPAVISYHPEKKKNTSRRPVSSWSNDLGPLESLTFILSHTPQTSSSPLWQRMETERHITDKTSHTQIFHRHQTSCRAKSHDPNKMKMISVGVKVGGYHHQPISGGVRHTWDSVGWINLKSHVWSPVSSHKVFSSPLSAEVILVQLTWRKAQVMMSYFEMPTILVDDWCCWLIYIYIQSTRLFLGRDRGKKNDAPDFHKRNFPWSLFYGVTFHVCQWAWRSSWLMKYT